MARCICLCNVIICIDYNIGETLNNPQIYLARWFTNLDLYFIVFYFLVAESMSSENGQRFISRNSLISKGSCFSPSVF